MEFIQPTNWDEALAAKAAAPRSMPIAGGTENPKPVFTETKTLEQASAA